MLASSPASILNHIRCGTGIPPDSITIRNALDRLISEIQTRETAIFPVRSLIPPDGLVHYFYPALPHLNHEIYFRLADISFNEFAICPDWGDFSGEVDADGKLTIIAKPKRFRSSVDTILNTLSDLGIGLKLDVVEDFVVGKYVGLDSHRHDLKNGDEIRSTVVRITLLRQEH
jgi:hypothetical protein